MANHGKLRRQITLGDDGELHQRIDDPNYQKDAIFCIHCSSANLPGAKFCSQCGGSLVEQQVDAPLFFDGDWTKNKNDEARKPKMALYDPSRYELKEKRPTPGDKAGAVILIVMAAIYMFPTILSWIANVVRFVNLHLTDIIVVLTAAVLIGGAWWLSKRLRYRN